MIDPLLVADDVLADLGHATYVSMRDALTDLATEVRRLRERRIKVTLYGTGRRIVHVQVLAADNWRTEWASMLPIETTGWTVEPVA